MNNIKAYLRLEEILNSLKPYSIDLTLERIKFFLDKIGNPQDRFKSILVGGTNGKGSVCQFLTDSFVYAGYKVGTYTSPHLIDINERFRINNKIINYTELLEYAECLYSILDDADLTYFEFLTALSFYSFAQNSVEIAILEVGMGGEFDATNVVEPLLSIITHISLDHKEHLGNTHQAIAKTKAKIIKNIGIIGKNSKLVQKTIKETTNKKLYYVNDSYINKASKIATLMKGNAAKENLAAALLSIDILNKQYNFKLSCEPLKKSFWPGRFEIIETDNKRFILDGGHNLNAALKLASSINHIEEQKLLIFSALKSKDWQNVLKVLLPYFNKIIIVPIHQHRLSEDAAAIYNFIEDKKKAIICKDMNEAIIYTLNRDEHTVVISGSLYLIAQAKASRILGRLLP